VFNKFSILLTVQLLLASCTHTSPGYEQWLQYAFQDLKAAKILSQENEICSMAFFLCQQSAEKALKAFLIHKQRPVQKTHDLTLLLKNCSVEVPAFKQLEHEAEMLNPFGPDIRYPNDIALPDKTTLQASIVEAERVLYFVKDHLR
jgi:HEPN domain-containing protein